MPELLTLIDPLTSCAVTAQATPNMTVAVAVGTVMVGNVVATVLPANVTIAAADATRDRVDAVVADSTGALSAIAGSTDDGFNARPPDTTGYALLAYVYVFSRAHASFTGTITSAMIDARLVGQQSVDARQFVSLPTPANSMAYTWDSGSTASGDPGAGKFRLNSTTDASLVTHIYASYYSTSWSQDARFTKLMVWFQPLGAGAVNVNPYYLRLWSRKQPNKVHVYRVTGFTDNGTWADLTVTLVAAVTEDAGGPSTPSPKLSTDSGDSIFEYAGSAVDVSALLNGSSALGADVAMTSANTFYDGPNTGSIGANGQKILLIAHATVIGGGVGQITMRITDGTTVFAEANGAGSATAGANLACSTVVSPSAAATYKITVASNQAGGTIKADPVVNSSGAHVATRLSYVRIA